MNHDFVWRGVVEGFYGKPWTHEERIDMISFMAETGMNAYMYAPKDDPYHRREWRKPYPATKMSELRELVSHARECGVSFVFSVSPGLSLRYSDKRDLEAFVSKFRSLYNAGVRAFAILYDDISPELSDADRKEFDNLASAQAWYANAVYERLQAMSGETALIVCPTQYRGDPDTDYVLGLGDGLAPQIDVMWTGPSVCSKELTLEHTQAASAALKRPVTYWDNYPVNDAAMKGELHIGPYTGRSSRLAEVSRGVFVNPMVQAEASKIAIAAAAEYMADPAAYDPQSAWETAVARLLGEHAVDAFAPFADACATSPLHPGEPPEIAALVGQVRARMDHYAFGEAAGILSSYALKMKSSATMIRTSSNAKFVHEAGPWIDEYFHWADIAAQIAKTLDAAGTYLDSLPPFTGAGALTLKALPLVMARKRLTSMLSEALDFKTMVCGNSLMYLGIDTVRRLR